LRVMPDRDPNTTSRMVARARALLSRLARLKRFIDPSWRGEAFYVLLIVTMGVVGGLVGLAYRLGLQLFQLIYFASSEDILTIATNLPWMRKLAAPAGGALIAALVLRYGLRGAPGEGMSEILEAVVLKEQMLRVRRALWKALSSLAAIG